MGNRPIVVNREDGKDLYVLVTTTNEPRPLKIWVNWTDTIDYLIKWFKFMKGDDPPIDTSGWFAFYKQPNGKYHRLLGRQTLGFYRRKITNGTTLYLNYHPCEYYEQEQLQIRRHLKRLVPEDELADYILKKRGGYFPWKQIK